MRVSLKAKLTALVSSQVLVVVMATSALYWSALIRHALDDVSSHAGDVAGNVFDQARGVLAGAHIPTGMNPEDRAQLRAFAQTTLSSNPGLLASIQTQTAFSQSLEYVAITSENGQVILHNDPLMVGHPFTAAPPFSVLAKAGFFHRLLIIFGRPQVYEVVLPLTYGSEPMDVRVGVSTVFVGELVKPELQNAIFETIAAIVLSTLTAALLSYLVLRPLQSIAENVDMMARGEAPGPVKVSGSDEWGVLSSKLNLLGERIRGEKAAYVALKENLDQLFANLADGLMFFDQQDRLVLATPAVARFLGQPIESLIRATPDVVFSGDDPVRQLLREAFKSRHPLSGQTVTGGGESRSGKIAVSLVFVEEHGSVVASLITLRDAETRAQLENQIDTAAKLAAIGRLTSGVAHEVRNPLNAMVLQLAVLKAKLGDRADDVTSHLEILNGEVHRLDRVVKTFLDFTRPVELRLADTNLDELLGEVLRTAEPEAQRNGVTVAFDRNGDGGAVARVDRDLIRQALLNLVINGCQAMPSGGELRVASYRHPKDVEIVIEDHGVGIAPAVRPRIFTLYFTTKTGGNGVGLAMSYRIVQLHNGTLDFTSEPNRGTTFRVTLPR